MAVTIRRGLKLPSLAARRPMFQFEFDETLFQLEQREPEFEPFVRVPLLSTLTPLRLFTLCTNPRAEHLPGLSEVNACHLMLMPADEPPFVVRQKAQ